MSRNNEHILLIIFGGQESSRGWELPGFLRVRGHITCYSEIQAGPTMSFQNHLGNGLARPEDVDPMWLFFGERAALLDISNPGGQ